MFHTATPRWRRSSAAQFMMLSLATDESQQPPWTISTTGNGPLPAGSHSSPNCIGPGP